MTVGEKMAALAQLLAVTDQGDAHAKAALWETLYRELRAMAGQKTPSEREGHALQPTALVHEVFLRLNGDEPHPPQWQGGGHFFTAATEAMRRILVKSARR